MEDKYLQQLKKGILEMLVLDFVCTKQTYGYELITNLKNGSGDMFVLKEGTLYPILYRLEDDGFILSEWQNGAGRATPKKMYAATETGFAENKRRKFVWSDFKNNVDALLSEGDTNL